MLSIIAAVGKNHEIGKAGGLCFRLPSDLRNFKKITSGHKVFMGSNTFKSLPKMLPGRKHIVLTRHPEGYPEEVDIVSSIDEVVDKYKNSHEEVFVIGGGRVYEMMLPFCDKLYLTEVDAEDKEADTFFPEFNPDDYERVVNGEEIDNGFSVVFAEYTRKERL